ncbi:MAG: hypothetical protein JKY76_00415 [Proteobacteria bacterium]|nr:hypothetical protein [Pseudomonadota bacterium]
MKKLLIGVVAVATMFMASAQAAEYMSFYNSGTLFKSCTSENAVEKAACYGYMAGVHDAVVSEIQFDGCAHKSAKPEELAETFISLMNGLGDISAYVTVSAIVNVNHSCDAD